MLVAFSEGGQLAVSRLLEVSPSLQEGNVVGMLKPGCGARAAAGSHFAVCLQLLCGNSVTLVMVVEPLLLGWAEEDMRTAGGPGQAEGNVPVCPMSCRTQEYQLYAVLPLGSILPMQPGIATRFAPSAAALALKSDRRAREGCAGIAVPCAARFAATPGPIQRLGVS